MDTVALVAKKREISGSRRARGARREGRIPAILYGHGMTPLSLEVSQRDLLRVLHTKAGENVVIDLKVEGTKLKESTCRIKDLQHNPVTDEIQHVDFTVISLTERIQVHVRLAVLNSEEAVGVKEGGVLDVVHHEISVECLPTQIPEQLEIDVRNMKIGDSHHIKDLAIPSGVVSMLDPEEVIVTLHPPKKVEETPSPEEEITQPEVIEKGKKEEKEEGAAPAEKKTEKPEKKEKEKEKE